MSTALRIRSDRPDPVLDRRRVVVDGVGVEYLDTGPRGGTEAVGPPLLLVHGHEQSAASWRWVVPALAASRRVVALSLPGHGASDAALAGWAPGDDLAPFTASFLDALGIGTADLVGNSVGGTIALRMALAEPDRFRTLTLVDAAGLGREVNPLLAWDTLAGVGEWAIALSRLPGGAALRSGMSAAMLFARPWRVPTEFYAEAHARGCRPGQLEASTAMARAMFDLRGQREVLLDRLPALPMPTLLVWGAWDYLLPVAHARAAVGRLRHGRLAVLERCGHLPHVEQPDRFVAVLEEFLRGTAAPRPARRHPPVGSS